jgi:hypothetical protein
MKAILSLFQVFALVLGFSFSISSFAGNPDHHIKHYMLVFGENPLFLSHVVYKSPHNFQVILQASLPTDILVQYQREKVLHPEDQILLLLEPIEIGKINTERPTLKGSLLREAKDGTTVEISPEVPVLNYQMIYFNELPLSLEAGSHH